MESSGKIFKVMSGRHAGRADHSACPPFSVGENVENFVGRLEDDDRKG